MKNNLLKYYIVAFYFCSTSLIFAQPGVEDDGGAGNLEGADPAVPIDEYIWVLAIVGLIFVYLRFKSRNRTVNS